jgi:hypothetical protein
MIDADGVDTSDAQTMSPQPIFQSALSEDHHRPALRLALSKYPSPGAKVKAKHLVRATVFSSNRAICPFIAKHREVEWMIPTLLDNHAISLGESTV